MQSQNFTVLCGIDCLACLVEFIMNNPLDVNENDEHALDFARHFPVGEMLLCLTVTTINPALVSLDKMVASSEVI
jgi:hypothetical protein